ncbi:MAG: class I SAM-dependent methyltransferase [Acidimicrobiales bacterium]|nr:class I SAM-dependent methyltransferase [Acidimicrobiales bacterium]
MEGYGPSSYGDGIADVYDAWYEAGFDTEAAVERLAALAGPGPVLELGVGTGRLALPLAARGLGVDGVDASAAMLDRLRAKPGAELIGLTHGDMAEAVPAGPYALVFVAANSFFGLTTLADQRRCLANVAARLAPGGAFVVEAFVPDDRIQRGSTVEVRALHADRVVLFVNRFEPVTQEAFGQHIDITEAGIRLRPSHLRYAPPAELDGLAIGAGLVLTDRWAGWRAEPFGPDSTTHVSVYRRG